MIRFIYDDISNNYYYQNEVGTLAGIKYSRQREAILAYLHSTKEHPTAEKVYMELRAQFPKLSLGTVYRLKFSVPTNTNPHHIL